MAYSLRVSLFIILIIGASLVSGSEDKKKSLLKTLQKHIFEVIDKGGVLVDAYEKIYDYFAPTSDYDVRTDEQRAMLMRRELQYLSSDVQDLKRTVVLNFQRLQAAGELVDDLKAIDEFFVRLTNLYKTFNNIIKVNSSATISDIRQFASTVKESDTGVDGTFEHVKRLFLRRITGKNVFEAFTDDRLKYKYMCPTGRSSQQNIYFYYKKVLRLELSGYLMNMLADRVRLEFEKREENHSDEYVYNTTVAQDLISAESFHSRMDSIFNEAKSAISHATRDVWKCDPPHHIEGETFFRFGPVFQKLIMHKKDHLTNNEIHSGHESFTNTCEKIKDKDQLHCTGEICNQERKCKGKIRECGFLTQNLTVCPSTDGYRRYKFILTGGETNLGSGRYCEDEIKFQSATGNILNYYCFCTCEETRLAKNAHISLRPVQSDIHDNKVVTGIQFYNEEDIFYILIQQGELGRNGNINGKTEWKEFHTFRHNHDNTADGVDFSRINWGSRHIYLGDRESVDENSVVTGLKFVKEKGTVALAVQYTKFNFSSGELHPGTSYWDTAFKKVLQFDLGVADVPTKHFGHEPSSIQGNYVEITTSDQNKDAGQNVVPFLDAQPVITNPPVPLSGAGLHLRSEQNSAGFLALKVLTYDIEKHFSSRKPILGDNDAILN